MNRQQRLEELAKQAKRTKTKRWGLWIGIGLPVAREIRWSDDMRSRWASCTPATSTIRVSTRIAAFPDWVVDYVLIHEMAHLLHAGHGADFWLAVSVYPRTERAIGYLIAKSGDDSEGLD